MGAVYHMNYSIGHFMAIALGSFGYITSALYISLAFPVILSVLIVILLLAIFR